MKAIFLLLLLPFSYTFAQTKKKVQNKTETSHTQTLSSIDSLSYSIGVQVAEYYKQTQNVEKVNAEYVKKAFNDVYE